MAITQITDRDGKATAYKPKCQQVLDPEVADATADVLSGVFTKGTMRGVGGIGRDAAGKTGTTDDYAAAWFAGFTPDLAGAVSIGDPRGSQEHKLNGVTIGGRYYGAVFGATMPGPIWKDTMLAALKDVPPTSFTPIELGAVRRLRPGLPPRAASPRTTATASRRPIPASTASRTPSPPPWTTRKPRRPATQPARSSLEAPP